MKIIKRGNPSVTEWWINKEFTCHACGLVGKLEKGDEQRAEWIFTPQPAESVAVMCPDCLSNVTIENPD